VASKIARCGLASRIAKLQIPERSKFERQGRIFEKEEIARILEEHLQRKVGDDNKTVRIKEGPRAERVVIPRSPSPGRSKSRERFIRAEHSGSLQFVARAKRPRVPFPCPGGDLRRRGDGQGAISPATNPGGEGSAGGQQEHHASAPDVLTDLREAVGKRMTLSLNSQEVLRKPMVEAPPLVKKGDRVPSCGKRSISDYRLGRSEGRRARGDRVRAVNVSSRKEIHGQVLDAHTS